MMAKWPFRLWALLLAIIGAWNNVKEIIDPATSWFWIAGSVLAVVSIIHFAVSAWWRA